MTRCEYCPVPIEDDDDVVRTPDGRHLAHVECMDEAMDPDHDLPRASAAWNAD